MVLDLSKKQKNLLLLILIITPLGFLTKSYSGWAAGWVNNSLSGVLYVVFWCLVGAFLFPASQNRKIVFWVVLLSSILEVAQLWHPPVLEYFRSFYLGRVLLGTSFCWSDFFYYLIGGGIGWWLLNYVHGLNPGNGK